MKEKLLRNILRPLIERVGTMVAVYLMASDVDGDTAAQIANGLVAAVLVAGDLILARFNPLAPREAA